VALQFHLFLVDNALLSIVEHVDKLPPGGAPVAQLYDADPLEGKTESERQTLRNDDGRFS
jgi:hypothetical protein